MSDIDDAFAAHHVQPAPLAVEKQVRIAANRQRLGRRAALAGAMRLRILTSNRVAFI